MASATTTYEVDPDWDLVLTLRNPNKPFAVWKDDFDRPSALQKQQSNDANEEEMPTVPPATQTNSAPAPTDEASPEEIHYRLSSKHLILASDVFRRMLTGFFREATVDEAGKYHITAEGWDQEVFLVLMNIIHSRNRRWIPRKVSLEFLAKIAELVEFYQCHEALEIWTNEIWLLKFGRWMPDSYGRYLILWIAVCWVFKHVGAFRDITWYACNFALGPIETLDLPIPSSIVGTIYFSDPAHQAPLIDVIDAIELRRQEAVEKIIDCLHQAVEKLRDETDCTFTCASAHLGALTKGMQASNLLYPRPSRPFIGYQVTELVARIEGFRTPESCIEYAISRATNAPRRIQLQRIRVQRAKRKYGEALWSESDNELPSACPSALMLSLAIRRVKDLEDKIKGFNLAEFWVGASSTE